MYVFAQKKEIRGALKSCLHTRLTPHLLSLGFFPSNGRISNKFKSKWIRDRDIEMDAIEFQWDDYQKPSFIINFRSFDHPSDLIMCRSDPKSIRAWDFGCRAYMDPNPFGWFRVRFRDRMFGLDRAISKVVQSAQMRLTEVSDFMTGHPPSRFLRDSHSWLDHRVLTNPPPWTGPPIDSLYHLPPRRVGYGNKLGSW